MIEAVCASNRCPGTQLAPDRMQAYMPQDSAKYAALAAEGQHPDPHPTHPRLNQTFLSKSSARSSSSHRNQDAVRLRPIALNVISVAALPVARFQPKKSSA